VIDFLEGKIAVKQPLRAVVTVNGIGFELAIPFSTASHLPKEGENVKILTHLVVREDDMQLYGFATPLERELFRLLIAVTKVGPKLAMSIMSSAAPKDLINMILTEDTAGLKTLKGVGPKLASRLVLEMKDKMLKAGFSSDETITPSREEKQIPFEEDIKAALENLGYNAREISACIKKVLPSVTADDTIESVIEKILISMAPN